MKERILLGLTGTGVVAVVVAIGVLGTTRPLGQDFWGSFGARGVQVENYDSLGAMARSADAVIVGRVLSIDPGRVYGERDEELDHPRDPQVFYANIKVDVVELLAGSLDPDWSLEVMVSSPQHVDELRKFISDGRAIYFLRSKERETRALDYGEKRVNDERGYYRLVRFEAVINDDHGDAVPAIPGEPAFASLPSQGFDATVDDVRRLAKQ